MYIFIMNMNVKVLTLRLDSALEEKLTDLARSMHRSRSFLAAEAIREYVAVSEWQIEETGKALKEADRGDFASHRDVQRIMGRWTRKNI